MNESNENNTYYITGDKYGVIEIDGYDLVPLVKSQKSEIDKRFPPDESQEQFVIFKEWLINEYYKDFEYTTIHYDNITF